MHPATIFASLAAVASVASAAAVPRIEGREEEVVCDFVTGWGCWSISNFTNTVSAAGDSHTLRFVAQQQSQTTFTTCTGTSEAGLTCDDSAYQAGVDSGVTVLTIHQKLYQSGAVAVLGGNSTLATTCTAAADGSSVCTQAPFKIQSKSVGTILGDGTKTGYTF